MSEAITNDQRYQEDYLPWANDLIHDEPATDLIQQAEADYAAVMNSTVFFQPPLKPLSAELTLPRLPKLHIKEDTVKIVAEFDMVRLSSLAINSLHGYLVSLHPRSESWPVRYREDGSSVNDELVKSKYARERAELLVVRTSAAMLKHIVHRVPVGIIPEEFQDWSLDESEMQRKTINALKRAEITTYGDLGILSLNQLRKIKGINTGGIEDIKHELDRRGWVSARLK